MKLDWEFGERIQCSAAEKKECMVLVAELCSMANKAKRNGLLSLVQEADETSHFLLRKGLQLVLEGVNPQMVEKTLQYYILSGKYHGKELLKRCIIMEGILAIQNGVNPTIIQELLLSLFGESSYKTYELEYGDGKNNRLKSFFNKIKQSRAATPLSSRLGHTIMQLNDQSIQQCLKEISTVDLARALKGIEGKAQIKVFKNLPKRSAAILQETVEHLDLMRESEMTEAQEKVLLIISSLEDREQALAPN
ncbi:MAG: FliG C-terminal domain-containing protein [Desulfobacterales bacterium]